VKMEKENETKKMPVEEKLEGENDMKKRIRKGMEGGRGGGCERGRCEEGEGAGEGGLRSQKGKQGGGSGRRLARKENKGREGWEGREVRNTVPYRQCLAPQSRSGQTRRSRINGAQSQGD